VGEPRYASAAVNVRRLWIIACTLAVALAVAACGSSNPHQGKPGQLTGHEVGNEANDGSYIQAGPITYQLEIARELNPYSVQDKPYVQGLPKGLAPPTANQIWYGVFLWAKNQHHHAYQTSDNFEIVDSEGSTYHPIKLNPAENPYAWTPQLLQKNQTEPGQDSIQSEGESQGGLVLFKLDNAVYSNRPLMLYVLGVHDRKLGSIFLDL
jgi:hypothetical protein